MSYALVSKTHVDAVVTAALRFGVLDSREAADRTGLALLVQNWNCVAYGDDEEMDDEERADLDAVMLQESGAEPPTSYACEELPGTPSPETVIQLLDCYRYQSMWEHQDLNQVESFVQALETRAHTLLGPLEHDEVRALPRYRNVPWLPEDTDRDLFVRLGG